MSRLDQLRLLPLWLLAPLLAAAGAIVWRGWLAPDALRDAPSRRLGLGATDLLVAAGLMLTGMSLGSLVVMRVKDAPLPTYLIATMAAQMLGLGLPALYLALRAARETRGLARIGYVPTRPGRDVKLGLLGAVLALMIVPGVILLGAIVGVLLGHEPATIAHDLLVRLRDSDSALGAVLLVVSAGLLAPLLEEAVYRGLWQSMLVETLGEDRRWLAVMVAALIFAAMHLGGTVDGQALPALWVLGVLLGWLYERTGSLLPGVIVHAAFNVFNISYVLLFG